MALRPKTPYPRSSVESRGDDVETATGTTSGIKPEKIDPRPGGTRIRDFKGPKFLGEEDMV